MITWNEGLRISRKTPGRYWVLNLGWIGYLYVEEGHEHAAFTFYRLRKRRKPVPEAPDKERTP